MQALLEFDAQLFLFFNHFHNLFWDIVFWLVTSVTVWIPMYLILLYVIIKGQGWQAWTTVIALILLVVLCDQISTNLFKEGFERLRPSHDPLLKDFVHLINNKHGGKFGFVSSHSTNTMGLAVFTSLLFRRSSYSLFIYLWAIVVSYSRIYMGVHFPGDVVGGWLLGILIGWMVYKLYALFLPSFVRLTFFNSIGLKKAIADQFQINSIRLVIYTGVFSFTFILIASKVVFKLL